MDFSSSKNRFCCAMDQMKQMQGLLDSATFIDSKGTRYVAFDSVSATIVN